MTPAPLPPDEFNLLLRRAGITRLAEAEVEDIRLAHAKLLAMLEVLRAPPPPLAAEPGFTFAAEEGA